MDVKGAVECFVDSVGVEVIFGNKELTSVLIVDSIDVIVEVSIVECNVSV